MGDKRLYKSSENSMLCGVCGGIAEYFHDPVVPVSAGHSAAEIDG